MICTDRKTWLDHLYYDVAKQSHNFNLQSTFIGRDGEIAHSRCRPYLDAQEDDWFMSNVNNRQQLLNEIILDLDDGDYKLLLRRLMKDSVEFYAYSTTGGRARHAHTYWLGLMHLSRKKREFIRSRIIRYYECDMAFMSDKHMISLEYVPHWKTGLKKLPVSDIALNKLK